MDILWNYNCTMMDKIICTGGEKQALTHTLTMSTQVNMQPFKGGLNLKLNGILRGQTNKEGVKERKKTIFETPRES